MRNFWLNLPKPFTVLAPMEDVTDYVFREIIAQTCPPDVFFTEFTSAGGLNSRGKNMVIRSLKISNKQHPIVAQIWGTDPNDFFKSAGLISELGFDGIDINMGCPDRGVVRKKAGSALITNLSLAKELIQATKEGAGQIPVSVKTRIGFKSVVTEEWTTFLLQQKINALTIHGRIANHKSEGSADWDEIEKVVNIKKQISPDTIIIGNGDVKSWAEVTTKYQESQIDGVMIGRGVFSDPWVFDKCEPKKLHSTWEYIQLLLNHARLFEETWQQTKSFEIMKKFFKMYIRDFVGADEFRQRLMTCHTYSEVKDVIKKMPPQN